MRTSFSAEEQSAPNIVLILADDKYEQSFQCMGIPNVSQLDWHKSRDVHFTRNAVEFCVIEQS